MNLPAVSPHCLPTFFIYRNSLYCWGSGLCSSVYAYLLLINCCLIWRRGLLWSALCLGENCSCLISSQRRTPAIQPAVPSTRCCCWFQSMAIDRNWLVLHSIEEIPWGMHPRHFRTKFRQNMEIKYYSYAERTVDWGSVQHSAFNTEFPILLQYCSWGICKIHSEL